MAPHATSPPPVSSPWDESNPPSITVLASSRAVIAGRLTPATIVISTITGKVTSVFHSVMSPSDFPPGTPFVDHSPHIILPGLVDAHVHLNEPGRTEWEGFYTGTRAAAFGGVTTVVDMPLNAIPPTTTVANLNEKIAAAQGKCYVDVGFYGGIIPGNEDHLVDLVNAGVRGFKGFLIESGVEEFPAVSAPDIAKAMTALADSPTVLMFHAEMIPPITDSIGDAVQTSLPPLAPTGPLSAYSTFLASRPPVFETAAIDQILSLAHLAPNLPLHIVHLSAAQALPLLRDARSRGVKITAETCFHYLSLAAEKIRDGDTRHKCCPPIREASNQDLLWQDLEKGLTDDQVIRTVVSDHSPCTPDLKLLPADLASPIPSSSSSEKTISEQEKDTSGDFFAAWGGISSVGLGLPILWTASQSRPTPLSIQTIVRLCCQETARQVGLEHVKGDLSIGYDGDVCVFDDTASFVVERAELLFRNKCSPYEGTRLTGVVRETWVRGRKVFGREGGFVEKGGPVGKLLLEKREMRV